MELQHFLDLILTAAMAFLGWFANTLWGSIRELENELSHVRENIAGQYVSKDELDRMLVRIESKLDRICDKLESKANRRGAE